MSEKRGWRYTGGGYGGWLHGIPSRDLSPEDVAALDDEQREALKNSGLYEPVSETKKAAGPSENKAGED